MERPRPDVEAVRVQLNGTNDSIVNLKTPKGELEVTLHVPGLYNVYNALAAVSASLALDIPLEAIKDGLEAFTAAFGRIERVSIPGPENKSLLLALVKNPVGFNEVLRMLFSGVGGRGSGVGDNIPKSTDSRLPTPDPQPKHLLLIINDLTADGRDVSWLWDVDFELLSAAGRLASTHVSGIRSGDMAVRLKYAGVDPALIRVNSNPAEALDAAIRDLPLGETLYVCPTYTAMLAFRKLLHNQGWVQSQFWED